jgi:hypothetical protein
LTFAGLVITDGARKRAVVGKHRRDGAGQICASREEG